jgi:sulfur transfer complex TusBCD TusB component (DsrH family)
MRTYVCMELNDWQNAIYYQLKERARTVPQLARANALGEQEILSLLSDLQARGLATEHDGSWHPA